MGCYNAGQLGTPRPYEAPRVKHVATIPEGDKGGYDTDQIIVNLVTALPGGSGKEGVRPSEEACLQIRH